MLGFLKKLGFGSSECCKGEKSSCSSESKEAKSGCCPTESAKTQGSCSTTKTGCC